MRVLVVLGAALLASACARTPAVSTTYYLAKSNLHMKAIQTLTCDKQNLPIVATSVSTVEVVHSADTTRLETLSLGQVDNAFANAELKTEFTPDGRLKGVNATTTGQGEAIFKAAISLATAMLDDPGTRAKVIAQCKALKKANGDKPVTLTYEQWDDLALEPNPALLAPLPESQIAYRNYRDLVGDLCLRKGAPTKRIPASHPQRKDEIMLWARQPAIMEAAISTGPVGGCGTANLWTGNILVGQHGERYSLPIPKAALFGKQAFAVTFDESGGLASLGYTKDSGAGPLLTTLQAGVDAARTTSAEEAASLKNEADLIAAQQRLVKCKADPAACA